MTTHTNGMRGVLILAAATLLAFSISSCKEEKKQEYIIVKQQPKPAKPQGPIAKDSVYSEQTVQWGEATYTVKTLCKPDKSLPVISEDDEKYYDNRASVKIIREDGTEAISKSFTKENFKSHIDKTLYENYSLLNIAYFQMDEKSQTLSFIVSVGSPDESSDSYVTLQMSLTKMGDTRVKPLVFDEQTGEEI